MVLILEQKLAMSKTILLFITVLTSMHWVKLAQQAEPIFLNLTLLMVALQL